MEQENEELKNIKKGYGEGMAKLCRELFPTLIEKGILFDIISDNFQENRSLSEDIIKNGLKYNFKNYINSLVEEEHVEKVIIDKTPTELLKMAGYDLFECKTEADIQKFNHYFAPGEKICTLNGGRLNKNYVFFAIKHNVRDIKREDFPKPLRQDEYGTSVISIQFSKGEINDLLITNRYNHLVTNCDATFSNNLDNIIEGLNTSFEKEYNLNIGNINKFNFEIPNYVRAGDGKFYKYNYELNNIYYCPNNIIIHNREVTEYDKNKYILVDYFLIDLENKSVSLCDKYIKDDFINHVKDIDKIEIKKLKTAETKGDKEIIIKRKDGSEIVIKTNKDNQMMDLVGDDITEIGDHFLYANKYLSEMTLPLVKNIGYQFLCFNHKLVKLNLPSVENIGNEFLYFNHKLDKLNLPLTKKIGFSFLYYNKDLKEISVPMLERVGDSFLVNNEELHKIDLPSIKEIGHGFLYFNEVLDDISVPMLERVGDNFLRNNRAFVNLSLPSLKTIGNDFLVNNKELHKIDLPSIKEIGNSFLYFNEVLDDISVPMLERVGDVFLRNNQALVNLSLPSLKIIGDDFLECNNILKEINAPLLEKVGDNFLRNNQVLVNLSLPFVQRIGRNFLFKNESLCKIEIPLVKEIGYNFLFKNESLCKIEMPLVKEIGYNFLCFNEILDEISAPMLKTAAFSFLRDNRALVNLSLPSLKEIGYDSLLLNSSLRNLYFPEVEKIGENTFKNHPLYSKMTVEKICKQSNKYKHKNKDAIEKMPLNNSFWNRFKQESLNFINKFRRQTTIDDSEQMTTTLVQDENSDELNNIIKESLDIKDQLRVTEKHKDKDEDKDRDENAIEQIDTQKPKELKESEEDDRLR